MRKMRKKSETNAQNNEIFSRLKMPVNDITHEDAFLTPSRTK